MDILTATRLPADIPLGNHRCGRFIGVAGNCFNPETDLDTVARLYDLSNTEQSGTIARTRAYWDMAPCRIREVLPTVVARRDGHIGGYLNYGIHDSELQTPPTKTAEVREVGYTSNNPEVLEALVSHFLKACESQGVEKVEGTFSPQHPFVERLTAGSNAALTPTTDTKMMLYAVNLPVLLRRLIVGWESRIADAKETFPPLTVKLPALNNQQAALRHQCGWHAANRS